MANGRSVEEEFHIGLQRIKDRAEAREQYFAESKRQFEETRVNWERDIAREKNQRIEAERCAQTFEMAFWGLRFVHGGTWFRVGFGNLFSSIRSLVTCRK